MALRHSAVGVVDRAHVHIRSPSRAIARFARPQSFAALADAEVAIIRTVRNVISFHLYYAALLWFLLLAFLFPNHRRTMLFLMAFTKIALDYGALLKAFPLLCQVIDCRAAPTLIMILGELVMTGVVEQLLLASGVKLPVVLLHAVFWMMKDELPEDGDGMGKAAEGFADEMYPALEKNEDLELGPQKLAE